MFDAAGVELSESALALLVDRTEGSAVGLGLAALSVAAHPDRERLADKFSGSDRTVAEYLFGEVLDRQREDAGTKASPRPEPERLRKPLTESEIRVLRYLPTNLTQPEIAEELSLSVNTINTHIRHLYTKLAAHRRREAVERARGLGLLAPASRPR